MLPHSVFLVVSVGGSIGCIFGLHFSAASVNQWISIIEMI